jgi:hypothetical protein
MVHTDGEELSLGSNARSFWMTEGVALGVEAVDEFSGTKSSS